MGFPGCHRMYVLICSTLSALLGILLAVTLGKIGGVRGGSKDCLPNMLDVGI